MKRSSDIQVFLNNIPSKVQCIEINEIERNLNYQHLKVLPTNILFFLIPLFISSSIKSVSTWHIILIDSRCSGQSLDILSLSNHTLEIPPFIGVYGLFKTKTNKQNQKENKGKGNVIKMDVSISKTLLCWIISISSKFYKLKSSYWKQPHAYCINLLAYTYTDPINIS